MRLPAYGSVVWLQETSWSGWGGWRMSTLLTTATDSVSTFSNHVTAGLSTVLETTVGAPDPETLAAAVQLHQADTPTSSDQGKAILVLQM